MRSLINYFACNNSTKRKLLKDGAIKNEDTGFVFYNNRLLIVDDFIKEPGLHEVYAGSYMELSFNDYATEAAKTAVYPGQGSFLGLIYVSLKASGEAGEFAENVGKTLRDDGIVEDVTTVEDCTVVSLGEVGTVRRNQLIGELGDELWYWFQKCRELGINPAEAARRNIEKLSRRAAENKIHGSGSER